MPNLKDPYDYRLNKPYICKILEKKEESSRACSLTVNYDPIPESVIIKPGQFFMVWVPGNDEVPMSVSRIYDDGKISLSIANVGETTQLLNNMDIGDEIGIRGPYGNSYTYTSSSDQIAIIIGGGIGMASLLPLIIEMKSLKNYKEICVIEGVKTETELLFYNELNSIIDLDNCDCNFCTDDGSFAFEGFPTVRLEEYLKEYTSNNLSTDLITVYCCGPEVMMKAVFEICKKYNITTQMSLERMMRCGFGICGLCALEPTGLLVCHDGPVFTNKDLQEFTEFGKSHRQFSGKEVPL